MAFVDVPDGNNLDSHRAEYEYGATLLAGTIGLITDLLLKGRYLFALMVIIVTLSVALHIIASIIYFVSGNDKIFSANFDFWILGFLQAFVYFL